MKNLADRVNNYADILDSRDIIERIEELEGEISDLEEERDELIEEREALMEEWRLNEDSDSGAEAMRKETIEERLSEVVERLSEIADELDELNTELRPIKDLADQCKGYGDFQHGEALIRDSYFEEYAQQLAEDIGAIPEGAQWPACFVDWERAADALKQDYSSVEFDKETYWMRS